MAPSVLQHLGQLMDTGQRRSEFMRNRGHEVRFQLRHGVNQGWIPRADLHAQRKSRIPNCVRTNMLTGCAGITGQQLPSGRKDTGPEIRSSISRQLSQQIGRIQNNRRKPFGIPECEDSDAAFDNAAQARRPVLAIFDVLCGGIRLLAVASSRSAFMNSMAKIIVMLSATHERSKFKRR